MNDNIHVTIMPGAVYNANVEQQNVFPALRRVENNYAQDAPQDGGHTQEQPRREAGGDAGDVRRAIQATLEAVDEHGDKIFTQNNQWWAVHRVLQELRGYTPVTEQFCKRMAEMGFGESAPFCKANDTSKAEVGWLNKISVKAWGGQLHRAKCAERRQIQVALELMRQLGES